MAEPPTGRMQIGDVRSIAIVGAGTMGQQIGFQCAGHGYDVVLYDIDSSALEAASTRIEAYADGLEAGGRITAELRSAAQARITLTTDLSSAAQDADLLSEAVPEDPELKGRVLAEFNAACPPRTIFMTNTSTLVPSQFARASGRGDRLLALHFHLPVWINNLADVMPHPGTAPEVTQLVLAFARRIDQVPIELHQEHNGYVFNSMYSARARRPAATRQRRVPQALRRSRGSRCQGRPGLLQLPGPCLRAAWLHRFARLVRTNAGRSQPASRPRAQRENLDPGRNSIP